MSSSATKHILVTGASGFIGRHMVAALLAEKHHVRGLIRSPSKQPDLSGSGLEWVVGDLRDRLSLMRALEDVEAVIHLGANVTDDQDSYSVNVEGVRNLIEACESRSVRRVINISTQSVKIQQKGLYASTKAEAEKILHRSALQVTTLRVSLVYGAGGTGLFAKIVNYVKLLPVIPICGTGEWRSRPIYIDDVVKVILRCLEDNNTVGKTYDVGGPEELTFNDLIQSVAKQLHVKRLKLHIPLPLGLLAAKFLALISSKPPITVSNILGSTQNVNCDISPMVRDLGILPISFSQGILSTFSSSPTPGSEIQLRLQTTSTASSSTSERSRKGQQKSVQVAVVGIGKMGLLHAAIVNVLPQARLIAVVDGNLSLRGLMRSMGLDVPFYNSIDSMLKNENPGAVFICTPTFAHSELVDACLAREVNVFVEKPLTQSYDSSRRLAITASERGVIHGVGYCLGYHRMFTRAADLLNQKILGEVRSFKAIMKHGEVFAPKRGWLFDPGKSGGGVIMNPTSHLIFLIHRYFGAPAVVEAHTRQIHSERVEDEAWVTFSYPNRLVGKLEASWSVPGKPLAEFCIDASGDNGRLTVNGTEIILELARASGEFPIGRHRIHISDIPAIGSFDLAPEIGGDMYFTQNQNFIRGCLEGRIPYTSFITAAEVEKTIASIYRSAREEQPVSQDGELL
jgi:predicted dehydrogenase/nucleoside-diphosphate-sugar epimerase